LVAIPAALRLDAERSVTEEAERDVEQAPSVVGVGMQIITHSTLISI
jgi:hypothetical protein